MIVPTGPEEYKLSNFKYMGFKSPEEKALEEMEKETVYWRPSPRDYSELTEKLRLQRLNR